MNRSYLVVFSYISASSASKRKSPGEREKVKIFIPPRLIARSAGFFHSRRKRRQMALSPLSRYFLPLSQKTALPFHSSRVSHVARGKPVNQNKHVFFFAPNRFIFFASKSPWGRETARENEVGESVVKTNGGRVSPVYRWARCDRSPASSSARRLVFCSPLHCFSLRKWKEHTET